MADAGIIDGEDPVYWTVILDKCGNISEALRSSITDIGNIDWQDLCLVDDDIE